MTARALCLGRNLTREGCDGSLHLDSSIRKLTEGADAFGNSSDLSHVCRVVSLMRERGILRELVPDGSLAGEPVQPRGRKPLSQGSGVDRIDNANYVVFQDEGEALNSVRTGARPSQQFDASQFEEEANAG